MSAPAKAATKTDDHRGSLPALRDARSASNPQAAPLPTLSAQEVQARIRAQTSSQLSAALRHVTIHPSGAALDRKEEDSPRPAQFIKLNGPVEFPLWAPKEKNFLENYGIGAAILQLLGVKVVNFEPKKCSDLFPNVRVTREGLEVLFFKDDPKANAAQFCAALKTAGCTTAASTAFKQESEDTPVGRVIIKCPYQYLTFLASHCRLNRFAIRFYLLSFEKELTPGIAHTQTEHPFAAAISNECMDCIDYKKFPERFNYKEWPEAFEIVDAYNTLIEAGIIRD